MSPTQNQNIPMVGCYTHLGDALEPLRSQQIQTRCSGKSGQRKVKHRFQLLQENPIATELPKFNHFVGFHTQASLNQIHPHGFCAKIP